MREPSVKATDAIRIQPSFEGDVGLRANASKVPAATRKALLREQFISEVSEYLLLHKGPDSDGKAHPTVKRIQVDILENAIEQAKSRGLVGEWRPYHFTGHIGTYAQSKYVDEVLSKRIGALLQSPQFNGQLTALLTGASQKDLLSPLVDVIAGRHVLVSMGAVGNQFSRSPFAVLRRFCELQAPSVVSSLRPYHVNEAPKRTFDDPAIVDELLVLKVNQLLDDPKYKGRLVKLLTECTQDEILSPLAHELAGIEVTVSMKAVGEGFQNSPYKMLKRYLEVTRPADAQSFRPYHMQSKSPRGTFEDPLIVDELLRKHCDALVGSQRFGGDIFKFFTEATQAVLEQPFVDTLLNEPVEVSTFRLCTIHDGSVFRMLCKYRDLKGLAEEYQDLRPYHLSKASNGIFNDRDVTDELLVKKVDQILESERFGGSMIRLLTEARQQDFGTPFQCLLAGNPVEVSCWQLLFTFNSSVHAILKRYSQLKGRPFDANPACFIGTAETRARRLQGDFNALDRRIMRTVSGDFDTSKFGMRAFNSAEKSVARELLVESAVGVLRETSVKYLGLEDQHLESIRLVRSYLNLSPDESVIVERDTRVFKAMNSLRKSLPNGEGKDLSKVKIIRGAAEDEIPHLEGQFNLVNLDFVGHLSQSNVDCIRGLLSGRLEDKAVIAVTLMDTPLARERTQRAGFGPNGARELPRIISEVSKEPDLYTVETIGEVAYSGGTGSRKTGMLTYFFSANRISDAGKTQNNQ